MRIFDDYELQKGRYKVRRSLLWEYDYDAFDFQKHRALVVQRVIQLGRLADFFAVFDLYGGIDAVAKIAKNEVDDLSDRDLQFMCDAFHLKKEETKCFIGKQ